MDPKLLFLSYLFPPRGGAGVQRALKFVKYLPQFGWKPLVIANGGVGQDWVTNTRDQSLLKDLPPDAVVRHTQLNDSERNRFDRFQSKWRQRLEFTDPCAWWIEPAVRTALELHREHHAQAIFVTMSPFTAAEAGIRLKRATGLPLILDLRDPWAIDETRIYPTRWHAWRDHRAMQRAFSAADLIIMNNPQSEQAARASFKIPSTTRLTHITNGFDAEDFLPRTASIDPAPRDTLRIVHTGMFHSELARIWDDIHHKSSLGARIKHARRPINLWTRTPRYLLASIERAIADGSIPKDKIELILAGEITDGDRALIESSPLRSIVRILGYRSHDESVQWLQSADVLFLPLHTPLDGGASLIVPGKAYEYLGSRRPILAMGPPGDMRDFITRSRAGIAIDGDDIPSASNALVNFYKAKLEQRQLYHTDPSTLAHFERLRLTRKLATALEDLRPAESASADADPHSYPKAHSDQSPEPTPAALSTP